jgi:hypothetical protein
MLTLLIHTLLTVTLPVIPDITVTGMVYIPVVVTTLPLDGVVQVILCMVVVTPMYGVM